MNEKAIWRFPTTFDGGGLGFNDGGTQLFKDDSIQSLAREVCQNSIDARHKNSDAPAEVEFVIFKMKKENFPGYEEFKKIIEREVAYCESYYKNNKNAVNYYQEALKTLNKDEITCLRISDYNTTGLTVGDNPKNNNWVNLVVHSGTNDKKAEDGGSFGLGKNAMYACSKFGTLYFSTNTDEGIKQSECMAKLSTYDCEDGTIVHGLGFYGMYDSPRSYDNEKPINDICRIDNNHTRRENETGTDVYILGFELPTADIFSDDVDSFSKFEADIAAAIIDNYFESIYNNKLFVKINDIVINKDNMKETFDQLYNYNPGLFNQNTADYLDVLTDPNATVEPICIMDPEIPDAELRIKLDPKYHNRIAMIKNTGMKIFDKGNFPQITLFSGMLTLKTNEVNGYFKKMENPAHDGWMLDRIKHDPTAKSKYDRMYGQVRDIIKKLAKDNTPESIDVVGLGEYLPDDISDGDEASKKENVNDEYAEKIEIREKVPLPNIEEVLKFEDGADETQTAMGVADDNGNYEAKYGKGGPNDTTVGETETKYASAGNGKLRINKSSVVKNLKKRCFYSNGNYNLIITAIEEMENCKVVVQYAGEQANYDPQIIGAYRERKMFGKAQLNYDGNIIEVGRIQNGEKIKVGFALNDNNNWSLEVNVYEN